MGNRNVHHEFDDQFGHQFYGHGYPGQFEEPRYRFRRWHHYHGYDPRLDGPWWHAERFGPAQWHKDFYQRHGYDFFGPPPAYYGHHHYHHGHGREHFAHVGPFGDPRYQFFDQQAFAKSEEAENVKGHRFGHHRRFGCGRRHSLGYSESDVKTAEKPTETNETK